MDEFIPLFNGQKYYIRGGRQNKEIPPHIILCAIATGLASITRFAGQQQYFPGINVAQHSIIACEIAKILHPGDFMIALGALMHDCHEGLGMGDQVSPVKGVFFSAKRIAFAEFEYRGVILGDLGHPYSKLRDFFRQTWFRDIIDEIDAAALLLERRMFMVFDGTLMDAFTIKEDGWPVIDKQTATRIAERVGSGNSHIFAEVMSAEAARRSWIAVDPVDLFSDE